MISCKVSILCLAYNHEKYIGKCLDGFIKQKTDFPFEVLVHDDASTDGTVDIIQEYALKYPDIIKPVIQCENQYSKGRMRHIYSNFLYPIAEGKYFAYCEGDDYWTDENKLQKQVDALDANESCHICLHMTRFANESGVFMDETFPQNPLPGGILDSMVFLKGLADGYFFHTSSFLVRADDVRNLIGEMPEFYKTSDLDDMPLLMYFGQLGDAYYIPLEMSCYRRESDGSWTLTERGDTEKTLCHKARFVRMYEQYDEYTQGCFHDLCEHWANNERFMMAEIKHDFKEMAKPQYSEWLEKRSISFRLKVKVMSKIGYSNAAS